MDFTFELSRMFNVLPFEIFKQDKDEVIMLINYMSAKGANGEKETSANRTEKERDRDFWSSL
jgi:hypothetical protein